MSSLQHPRLAAVLSHLSHMMGWWYTLVVCTRNSLAKACVCVPWLLFINSCSGCCRMMAVNHKLFFPFPPFFPGHPPMTDAQQLQ